MNHTIRQIFRSGKFVFGFCIFVTLIAIAFVSPLFITDDPLGIIAQGTFFEPGIYVSTYDTLNSHPYILKLDDATQNRIDSKLSDEDRLQMKTWLLAAEVPEAQIDIVNTQKLLDLWAKNYDPNKSLGMTFAKQREFQRLNAGLQSLMTNEPMIIAQTNSTGSLEQKSLVNPNDYVNVGQVANVRLLALGTDNFGRDVLIELIKALSVSMQIGFVAGSIATVIGLTLGLLAGYLGGIVDDVIMFITNLFTVIPSIVLLILISYSISQAQRGAFTVATVIGFTSWVWTARAVRAQVSSLRNRDHVNLSKISGHSIFHIIFADILPYIASYVVMALILQISSAILAEASLSILGLGPKTSEVPTLGLMINWALIYQAQILGKWWAYLPVLVTIALTTFSMNLMNTGLDQVFNPALRD
jgi:peptide/nickel transport system permease protein